MLECEEVIEKVVDDVQIMEWIDEIEDDQKWCYLVDNEEVNIKL